MALVTCPECGKENVSDSAASCPNCGYNIADYFIQLDKVKRAEEREKAEIEELINTGVLDKNTIDGIQEGRDMKEEIKRDKEISKISIPENPATSFFDGVTIFACILGVLLIIGGICGLILSEPIILVLITFGFGAWFIGGVTSSYHKEKAEYQLYQELGEREYKKRKYEEKERAQANKDPLTTLYQQQQQQASIIWCPMCHMPSGEKISTTRRVVSTTALGLASSDIGKQYRCKNCGHKW